MSRIGAHVAQGPRNGYGPFCEAKPAVILAVDEWGALDEAYTKSQGHTITVFRDTSVYLEIFGDFNTVGDLVAAARYWYPELRNKWLQNPAHYYTISNETGGNDPVVMQRLVTYEREIMRLANLDGIQVCVLNQATGTPGSFEDWKQIYAPFIIEAWENGNIYGRHVYGEGDLVDQFGDALPGGPIRPFQELDYLRSLGVQGGIAITECGLDAGFNYPGSQRTLDQMVGYEKLMRNYPEFIGICWWTLGTHQSNANWQQAMPDVTNYMLANPSDPWFPPVPVPVPGCQAREPYKRVYWVVPQAITRQGFMDLAGQAYDEGRRTIGGSFDDAGLGCGLTSKTAVLFDIPLDQRQVFLDWYDMHYPGTIVEFRDTGFRFHVYPVEGKPLQINPGGQWNAPRDYFGDHEGVDLYAPHGSRIVSVAPGIVDGVRLTDPGSGYGIYVRVRHQNANEVHFTWYGHLMAVAQGIQVGVQVGPGQLLGWANNTGTSTGSHLHLTLQKIPGGLEGYIVDSVIDPTPFLQAI